MMKSIQVNDNIVLKNLETCSYQGQFVLQHIDLKVVTRNRPYEIIWIEE